jgi:hypothetical protein
MQVRKASGLRSRFSELGVDRLVLMLKTASRKAPTVISKVSVADVDLSFAYTSKA